MRTHDFVKFRLDPSKFIGQDRLEQLDLAREMRVERFFANAQFRSQIVHRDTAEPVTEKVSPGRFDDFLSTGLALSVARPECVRTLPVSATKHSWITRLSFFARAPPI